MTDSPVTSDEFSKEEVEELLKEEPEVEEFNLKTKMEMTNHNKRLKLCIKWFQQVNENLNLDKVKLQSDLEAMHKKWFDAEMDMLDIADHMTRKKIKLRKRYTTYKKKKRAEVADLKNLCKAADMKFFEGKEKLTGENELYTLNGHCNSPQDQSIVCKVQTLEAKLAKYEKTLGDNGWDRLNTKALSLEACSSQRAEKLEHQLAAVYEERKKSHLSSLEAGN